MFKFDLPSAGIAPVSLPVYYPDLGPHERPLIRKRYTALQDGLCLHCGEPLDGDPSSEMDEHRINWGLFPKGFLDHPVHLHHDHVTGMTIGVVHALCNAVLWQFHGE